MKATLTSIEQINHNVKTFWLKTDQSINNVAGQFTEISLPHQNPDDRGEKRWFTLSSSPTEGLASITTKFSDPSSTFKQTLKDLKVGSVINLAEPMGDFVLPKDKTLPLVFVAGGIGITPFRSIIKWLIDTSEKRDITLIYAAQTPEDLPFIDLFTSYGAKVVPIISQEAKGWDGLTGRLTVDQIKELAKVTDKTLVFISGPEPMVESLTNGLIASGTPKHQVIGDYFPGYPEDL